MKNVWLKLSVKEMMVRRVSFHQMPTKASDPERAQESLARVLVSAFDL